MKLEGTWCTEDIDNEHLQLRVFSTAEKNSFFKFCNERYVVFLERAKEISKKEYELIFKEQFYLSELQQISWCISTKQQYGTVSDLNFADYENVFDYSFDFTSKRVDKVLERKIRLWYPARSCNKIIICMNLARSCKIAILYRLGPHLISQKDFFKKKMER